MHLVLRLILCSLFIGCSSTFVKTSLQGEKVRLLEKHEIRTCKYLGKTTVSVLDKVVFISRQQSSVAANLKTLAQNSAAEMTADTIVKAGPIQDGKQTFNVYKCVNPNGK